MEERGLFGLLFDALRDGADPGARVFRKAMAFAILGAGYIVWIRHVDYGFDSFGSVLKTAILSSMLVGVVGVIGGISADSFYQIFLKAVGASNTGSSMSIFVVECLIALTAPIFALLFSALYSGWEQ